MSIKDTAKKLRGDGYAIRVFKKEQKITISFSDPMSREKFIIMNDFDEKGSCVRVERTMSTRNSTGTNHIAVLYFEV